MTARVDRNRTIAAGAQTIWAVLADFGALSGWSEKVDHSSVLEHGNPGPIGTARRVQVGRNTLVERITTFTPPSELAYTISELPAWLGRLANSWHLTPTAGDGTVVTVTSTVDMGNRLPQRLAERAVCRALAGQSDAMLAGLANRVENRRG